MERHHLGVTRNALRENRLVIFGLCSIGLRRHGPFISCHIFLPLCFALSGTHLGSSLELYANFTIVMGAQLPVTVCRKGSRLVWEHFDSASAHLQPKRSRAAIAQGVVLDSIVKQIEKALGLKFWTMKKKTGIKTLSHLGQSFLQKRTGYIRRPSMLHADLTIELVDRFLHCCKDNHNYNLEMVPKHFLQSLPKPRDVVLPDPLVELTPEAVVYHKKIFTRAKKTKW